MHTFISYNQFQSCMVTIGEKKGNCPAFVDGPSVIRLSLISGLTESMRWTNTSIFI